MLVRLRSVALSVLVLVLVLLALATPAQAHRRHQRMTFHYATVVAAHYWSHRDIKVPCQPRPDVLTEAETATWGYEIQMLADVPACTIDITPWADGLRTDRDLDWIYCQEVVHEVGHLAGLDHEYGGVMDPDANVVPWGCDHPWKFRRRHTEMTQTWRSG